jgi:hypothetical protein
MEVLLYLIRFSMNRKRYVMMVYKLLQREILSLSYADQREGGRLT